MEMRINYNQVIQQANRISEEVGRISKNVTKLDGMIHQVPTSWKGAASQTFLIKCHELRQEMVHTQKRAENLAITIKTIANRIRQEDEEEAKRAQQLRS